jgi:transketolase
MRRAFAQTLVELADRDDRIVLLTGDLGYTVLEPFIEQHPDRFFNAGVAEQNMVGLATGLAEAGFVPFVYSIATFATLRPYEFIRNGPALHQLPVRIVGVGGGFDYGHNGVSHYALEDIALMRAQPGMSVVAPADPDQTRSVLAALWDCPGPLYLRLGRESKSVPGLGGEFEPGRLSMIGDGADVVFVTLGTMAREAVAAAELLDEQGISASVAVLASVAPSPEDHLAEVLSRVPVAMTVEAHYTVGGVGSLVAEVIAERGLDCRLVRQGIREMPRGDTGGEEYLYATHGLAREKLAGAVVRALSLADR